MYFPEEGENRVLISSGDLKTRERAQQVIFLAYHKLLFLSKHAQYFRDIPDFNGEVISGVHFAFLDTYYNVITFILKLTFIFNSQLFNKDKVLFS